MTLATTSQTPALIFKWNVPTHQGVDVKCKGTVGRVHPSDVQLHNFPKATAAIFIFRDSDKGHTLYGSCDLYLLQNISNKAIERLSYAAVT